MPIPAHEQDLEPKTMVWKLDVVQYNDQSVPIGVETISRVVTRKPAETHAEFTRRLISQAQASGFVPVAGSLFHIGDHVTDVTVDVNVRENQS